MRDLYKEYVLEILDLESSSETLVDYTNMKVIDLKKELERSGLSTSGLKKELISRLSKDPIVEKKSVFILFYVTFEDKVIYPSYDYENVDIVAIYNTKDEAISTMRKMQEGIFSHVPYLDEYEGDHPQTYFDVRTFDIGIVNKYYINPIYLA